jgi:hypothetical protein
VEDSSTEEDSLGASGTSAGEHADKTDASIITVNKKARSFFKLYPSFRNKGKSDIVLPQLSY